jgi:F0F1-type ATP synthase membrane subunit b/b'
MSSQTKNGQESAPQSIVELRKRAELRRAQLKKAEAEARRDKIKQRQTYERLVPPLNYIRCYMNELAELLNELKAEIQIPVQYDICALKTTEGHSTHIRDLQTIEGHLTDFKVTTIGDFGENRVGDFALSCQCSSERNNFLRLFDFRDNHHSRNTKTELEQSLSDYHLAFRTFEKKCCDGSIQVEFQIDNTVNVEFRFLGNSKTGLIDLIIQNNGGLGQNGELGHIELAFSPYKVNIDLIEAIVRCVMRKPSQLHSLAMSPTQSQKLKTAVPYRAPSSLGENMTNIAEILDRIEKGTETLKQEQQAIKKTIKNTQKQTQQAIKTSEKEVKKAIETSQQENKKAFEDLKVTMAQEHAKTQTNIKEDMAEFDTWLAENQQTQKATTTILSWFVAALFQRKNR